MPNSCIDVACSVSGHTATSRRLYDFVAAGCIPVKLDYEMDQ